MPFSLLHDEIWCCLVGSALIGLGQLVQGQTSSACAIFSRYKDRFSPPSFTFGGRYPGCVWLSVSPEKPPTFLPLFNTFFKKNHFIIIREMTFPPGFSKQMPCRELQDV